MVERAIAERILELTPDLYRVAWRMTCREHEAEELVSETVVKALEHLEDLHDAEKLKQWLLRIMQNTFLSSRRRQTRHPTVSLETAETVERFSFYEAARASFQEYHHPERDLIAGLLTTEIELALQELPESYRTAVVLCDIEGYSYEEIGSILSIPIGTVRSRLSRGRVQLQKRLWHHALDHGITFQKKSVSPLTAKDDGVCTCE